jgi:hypothetical protein
MMNKKSETRQYACSRQFASLFLPSLFFLEKAALWAAVARPFCIEKAFLASTGRRFAQFLQFHHIGLEQP